MKRLDQIEKDFRSALVSLEEALSTAMTDLEIDGSIQRFEFTYELFWKYMRIYLQREGIVANSPKECFKEAFRLGLIRDEASALQMIDDRNLTAHLYDKDASRAIFDRVKSTHCKLFRETLDRTTSPSR